MIILSNQVSKKQDLRKDTAENLERTVLCNRNRLIFFIERYEVAYTIENCRNCLTRHIKLSKIKHSDRVAETCEACDRGRTCGGSSFFILGDSVYAKNFLNYDQQIEKLKNEKNLLIDNEAYAKEILKQTSYYSLIGGYKDIFKNPTTKKYKELPV